MNDRLSLRGRVGAPDRLQRLIIGLILLILNLIGMTQHVGWISLVALGVQIELIITAVAGWCPLYWSFNTHSRSVR